MYLIAVSRNMHIKCLHFTIINNNVKLNQVSNAGFKSFIFTCPPLFCF